MQTTSPYGVFSTPPEPLPLARLGSGRDTRDLFRRFEHSNHQRIVTGKTHRCLDTARCGGRVVGAASRVATIFKAVEGEGAAARPENKQVREPATVNPADGRSPRTQYSPRAGSSGREQPTRCRGAARPLPDASASASATKFAQSRADASTGKSVATSPCCKMEPTPPALGARRGTRPRHSGR